jgi:hypothetical protein
MSVCGFKRWDGSDRSYLVDGAGRVRGGHVGNLDLEVAIVVGRAAIRSRGVRLDLLSDALGDGRSDSDGREGNGGGSVAHVDCWLVG